MLSKAVVVSCLTFVSAAQADQLAVMVADTGCVGRQQTVRKLWMGLPGVESVTVLPNQADNRGPSHTFVVTSSGDSPDVGKLTEALGRRAKQFRILSHRSIDGETKQKSH